METSFESIFKQNYQTHLKHLKLKGLQPKTIDAYAYARAIRRAGEYFNYQITDLSEAQLTDYFSDLPASHSWSTVKLDLYGLQFFHSHVLHQPWPTVNLIKPPKTQRLPDIVTVDEARRLFAMTRNLSYRVLFFTLYKHGAAPGRRLASDRGGYRCRSPAGAYSRRQGQQRQVFAPAKPVSSIIQTFEADFLAGYPNVLTSRLNSVR